MFKYKGAVDNESLKEKLTSIDEAVEEQSPVVEKGQQNQTPHHLMTYISANISALAYGLHNYLVALAAKTRPDISCIYPQWMTFILVFMLFHGYLGIEAKVQTGNFWNKKNSAYYKMDPSKFDYVCLAFILLRVIGSVGSFVNLYYVSQMAIFADMSPALAVSFSSCSIFLVAIVFYFMFGDKVNLKLFIGMMFVISAVMLVGFSSNSAREDTGMQQVASVMTIIPILLGLSQGVLNAYNSLCLKLIGTRGYSSLRTTIDYLFLYSFFPMAFYIYEEVYGESYSLKSVLIIQGASLFLIIGHFLAVFSLKHGNGGKTQAILQLAVIYQISTEVIFDGRIPRVYEVTAIFLGVIGAIIMANK